MYRYSVDQSIAYTPDDIALFRESPFAVWMERLTLENPDHGILPDAKSHPPIDSTQRQDELVDTLRAEGRDVALIDWDAPEPDRRSATLAAMHGGADFIVNAALASDILSCTANLLMRTSGYSELGDYLYVPCDTQGQSKLQSAFRLCFVAEMLAEVQGQVPPQMLLIRGDAEVHPLQTEDHIYYFNAVKKRFLTAMRGFRKHRMPNPAESASFGRWFECAAEVLKQRALAEEAQDQQAQDADMALEAETAMHQMSEAAAVIAADAAAEHAAEQFADEQTDEAEINLDLELHDEAHSEIPLDDALTTEADTWEEALVAAPADELVPSEVSAAEVVPASEALLSSEAESEESANETPDHRRDPREDALAQQTAEQPAAPMMQAAGAGAQTIEALGGRNFFEPEALVTRLTDGPTLAEQASQLQPGRFTPGSGPGRTPNLAMFSGPESTKGKKTSGSKRSVDVDGDSDASSFVDSALENLAFIGSGPEWVFEDAEVPSEPCDGLTHGEGENADINPITSDVGASLNEDDRQPSLKSDDAPPPNLRHVPGASESKSGNGVAGVVSASIRPRNPLPDLEPPAPALLPPSQEPLGAVSVEPRKPHPLDSEGFSTANGKAAGAEAFGESSSIDRDEVADEVTNVARDSNPRHTGFSAEDAPASSLAPLETDGFGVDERVAKPAARKEPPWAPSRTFSDSLITSERFDEP